MKNIIFYFVWKSIKETKKNWINFIRSIFYIQVKLKICHKKKTHLKTRLQKDTLFKVRLQKGALFKTPLLKGDLFKTPLLKGALFKIG